MMQILIALLIVLGLGANAQAHGTGGNNACHTHDGKTWHCHKRGK